MGIFEAFSSINLHKENATFDLSTPCKFPKEFCMSYDLATFLNILFGVLLIATLIVSTVLNPVVLVLKVKEKTQAGYLFAVLSMIDFFINALRAPGIVYTLLQLNTPAPLLKQATTSEKIISIVYNVLQGNEVFITFLLSVMRFQKIKHAFFWIKNRWLVLAAFVFNIGLVTLTILMTVNSKTGVGYFLSPPQIVLRQPILGLLNERAGWVFLLTILNWTALVFSIGSIVLLQKNGANMTDRSRENARKACKALVGMNVLYVIQLTGLVLAFSLHQVLNRLFYYTLVVFVSVANPHFISAINPVLVLVFGYSFTDIRNVYCTFRM